MSETWTISVGGRAYGPYNAEQMRTFQAEGRLAGHSMVARAGEEQFHPAAEDAQLAPLFATEAKAQSQPVETAQPVPAPQEAEPVAASPNATPHRFGRDVESSGEQNRYVIMSDMKSGSITGLEEEIFNLGPACRFMPQGWILSSAASLNAIRGGLIQKLGKLDTLFIVDTAHDKAAWFNFGPEMDIKVRRMWARPDQHKAG
jgi:hypothetical protein